VTTASLSYALITPARDEAENLRRLGRCLIDQSVRPTRWIVVDNSSTDETRAVGDVLEREHSWIEVMSTVGERWPTRGGPIVRAFQAGLGALAEEPDIVVKLDADVSLAPNYFEQLLSKFAADPLLGIASGTCYELEDGTWRPQHVTRSHVRGATRAYRWRCLKDVLPLETRIGWDGIDEIKATLHGWKTKSFSDLPFYHHRRLGQRETPPRVWLEQGRMAHYMGYRFSYLVFRALYRSRQDLRALAMIAGFAGAVARREPRCPDTEVRAHLRREQSLRKLPVRIREALGRADS
jgi:biofilm PGA synthesis N-glycosyltransferase PgaC